MSEGISINSLLKSVVDHNASDLHLLADCEPRVRIDGILVALNLPKFPASAIDSICYTLISDKQKKFLEENLELDFSIDIPNLGRFRGNYYYTMDNKLAAAFRIIPQDMPTIDGYGMPKIFKELIVREKGLILVTGPTGSGKSTTLAAFVNEINVNEKKHILTIEDPIEFIHESKQSILSQRGVGEDTKSFSNGLKYALRQDPDIIYVGELRDKETMEIAITAAETGHLVFASLHTNSAVQTVGRIVETFPEAEQSQIRNMLSITMTAVVSQMLIPKIGGGRIPVFDILINNPAVANLIRENKTHQIASQMQINQSVTGMMTQNQSILEALVANKVTKDNALRYSNNQEELKSKIVALGLS